MPGTGKTTLKLAIIKILQAKGKRALFIRTKDCSESPVEIQVPERVIVNHISSILQYTVSDGFRVSFDALSIAGCDTIDCLITFTEKRYRDDIAQWVIARLKQLKRFVNSDRIILPTCLKEADELIRRITVGVLYAVRPYITYPIILDDLLSLIINELYREAFVAMMRPYWVSINRYLETRDLLLYNPVAITPGGASGVYRLAHPFRYVLIFDHQRWELDRKAVEKIAYSS